MLDIQKKFQIYNALFLKLSYRGANDFAHLIPILGTITKQKLQEGNDPIQVLNEFYEDYQDIIGVDKKISNHDKNNSKNDKKYSIGDKKNSRGDQRSYQR